MTGSESQRNKALELLAARVVAMLEPRLRDLIRAELEYRDAQPPTKLGDATQLARVLGVSRATVYQHADELGAIRVGDGKRPRLRFDIGEAVETWRSR